MKIVVTGHRGYLGSRVFFRLRMKGLNPVGYDVQEAALNKEVPKADTIVHLASRLDDSKDMIKNNLSITARVLESINKIVFSSSAAVYGNSKKPSKETDKLKPINKYGKTKMVEEGLIKNFSEEFSILRLANLYSFDADHGIVAELNKGNRMVYGEGKKTRDYLLVDDAVDVIVEAALSSKWDGIYNIGTGKRTSTIELFNRLCPDDEPVFAKKAEINHSCLDITKAKKKGFKPFTI